MLLAATAVILMVFCPTASLGATEPKAEQEAVKRGMVLYEDFGAKDDGKTDDQAAIALAHQRQPRHVPRCGREGT